MSVPLFWMLLSMPLFAAENTPVATVVLSESFESLTPGPLQAEEHPELGHKIWIFNPDDGHGAEVQQETVHSGRQALSLTHDGERGTVVYLMSNPSVANPTENSTFRITTAFLRETRSGGGLRVNFTGGGNEYNAGWHVNPLRRTFSYWLNEEGGTWKDSEVPAPELEWLTLEIVILIEDDLQGGLSGSYDLWLESAVQERIAVAEAVPLGGVERSALRIMINNDRPLPGDASATIYWDDIQVAMEMK